jgi:predicted nucleic acid-binding protein
VKVALIDTGPMVALFDASDVAHRHYTRLLAENWRLTTTWPCVVEVCHFLGANAVQRFLRWVSEGGVIVFPFDVSNLPDFAELMARHTEELKRGAGGGSGGSGGGGAGSGAGGTGGAGGSADM